MKNIKLYLIELLLVISIIVFNVVLQNNNYLYISIIALAVVTYLLFGVFRSNTYVKSNVIRVIVACLLSFFIVSYATGLFVGFSKTIFSFSINFFAKVILLEILLIIAEEYLRYTIIKKTVKGIAPIVVFTIIMSLLNIMIEISGYNFNDREIVFIFASVVILPVISRELLCSYLSYKVGMIPCIIFKIVITLYEYVLPIIPNLGNYLFSVYNVILCYVIYFFSSKTIMYAEKSNKYTAKVSTRVIYFPIIAMLLVIVVLVSGFLKYKMIAIGSNSMFPVYEKGDAIIYRKVKDIDELSIGDIIAFKKSDAVITHRIVNITSSGKVLKTKGDNNNSVDYFDVGMSDVLGKVEYKIRYIGYPTIWINEFFKRGEMNYEQ